MLTCNLLRVFLTGALAGAYGNVANGYALMDYSGGDVNGSPAELTGVLDWDSPLMIGVDSLVASQAIRSYNAITNDAIVVAHWGNQHDNQDLVPLVLRGTRNGRLLVELNFLPLTDSTFPGSWVGSGGELMRNALKYSRCMPPISESTCQPGTYSSAGFFRGAKGE
jgi:hypothetical protein